VLQQLRHLGPDIIAADLGKIGLTVLNDLGVGTVVLDRYKMPGGDERTYTEAVANAIFAAVAPEYADERITVYAVPPAPESAAYAQLGARNWGPLDEDGDVRYRVLTGPAELQLAHLPPAATLAITYRSAAGVGLRVIADDGATLLATLPPAPTGATVAVALDGLPQPSDGADAAGLTTIVLVPDGAGQARIERLALR
jgi:hypothetical protein